jgi:indole-3-glycerol phosphate synthase
MPTKELIPQFEILIAARRQQVQERRALTPIEAVRALASMQKRPQPVLTSVPQTGQVALFGQINPDDDDPLLRAPRLLDNIRRLVQSRVDGIALVSDEPLYQQGLEDLIVISRELNHSDLPSIYRDIIVDEYQVVEARAAGASALLLQASVLEPTLLRALVSSTQRHRMTSIIEVRNRTELENALSLRPYAIALCQVDPFTSQSLRGVLPELRQLIPASTHVVLAEALRTMEDVRFAVQLKVHAAFVAADLLLDPVHLVMLQSLFRRPTSG